MIIDRKRSALIALLLLAACGDGDSASESATVDFSQAPAAATASTEMAGSGVAGSGYSGDAVAQRAAAAPAGATQSTPIPMTAADTAASEAVQPGTVPVAPAVSLNPMLIRTGTATVQVDSLEAGIAQVRALARRVGGIVGATTISAGSEQERQAVLELRIPSQNFDAAVSGLNPLGMVRGVNVTAEDVGEEYTDVSARVANSRRLEARLLDLLENRTGKLDELLSLEREVARVREEIERYEGRLRYLRSRASISTLTITLHEGVAPLAGPPGERPIRDAFASSWHNFVGLIAGLIAMLGWLLPLAFVAYGAWRVFRWLRAREAGRDAAYREAIRRSRERAPAEAEEPAPLP